MAGRRGEISWQGPALVVVGLLLAVLDIVGWFVFWSGGSPTGPFIAGWPRGPTWTLVVIAIACIAAGVWRMRRQALALTTTADLATAFKTPAASIAAQVGIFVGLVMGGLYALLNLSGHRDYDLAARVLLVWGGYAFFYGGLASVISLAVIGMWRLIRR